MTGAHVLSQQQAHTGSNANQAAKFMKDEELVAVAKKGSEIVFDELFRRHAKQMWQIAQRITRHREDAEDAVQECFTSAYLHLDSFDGRARFETWLTRIAINAALMKSRKARRSREVPLEDPTETIESAPNHFARLPATNPEDACINGEQEEALREAIARLRPLLRKAIELYQLQELSLQETAKALGISIAAAKGRVFRAHGALRRSRELKAVRMPYSGRTSVREQLARLRCSG